MGKEPLVSIITPVRNNIRYVKKCINSVLNQNYSNTEHIFIDGCSTDGTVDVLAKYGAKYPKRVKFISEPDKGPCDAWNKGLRLAKGDIIGWLGADDSYEPNAIRIIIKFFKSNPEAYFVFGDCNVVDENGIMIRKPSLRDFDMNEIFKNRNYVPTTSTFYRREVIEKIGFMDISIHACDLDFLLRAGKVFKIYKINNTLSNFRKHSQSVSCAKSAGLMYAKEEFILSRRYGKSIPAACLIYLKFAIIELLRPAFGKFYSALDERVVRRNWKKPVKANAGD
ncbi:MAG: glycosyltransferase family 2 protein [DPANN group archaeon]|nr:glycosyltransferase family 2 protein [DPANN group archaeon]